MASSSGEMKALNAEGTPYTPAGRWFFTKEQLLVTPSVRAGLPLAKEISYRQQAANFIQDMGQHLRVTQLCINTAIVYTYRFFMFHSYQRFHRNSIALAALFLAAKVEEQPRKLEHVIKMAHICLNGNKAPPLDIRSESYHEKAQELVTNENTLLQTLGFDVAIDHPHTHVVRCCQLVKASKELAQASYYLATNSLHLTTMCLRYTPTIVACFCIHLACKWSNYKIPLSAQNKEWYVYVDPAATHEILEELTEEFLTVYDQCPSRLKKKIEASTQAARGEEEHKQSQSSNSIVPQHTNGPAVGPFPNVSAPLPNAFPPTSGGRAGTSQHPVQNSDADHQRRVASHQASSRPPSQQHHGTSLAKAPSSSIFDAPGLRPSHGEKMSAPMPTHPSNSGRSVSSSKPAVSGAGDYKVPQLTHPSHDKLHQHQKPQPHLPPYHSQQQQSHRQPLPPHHQQQPGAVIPSNRSSAQHHPQMSGTVPSSQHRSSSVPHQGAPNNGRPSIPVASQHRSSSSNSIKSEHATSEVGSAPSLPQQPSSRTKTPPSITLSATARSIFDIDSPVKSFNEPQLSAVDTFSHPSMVKIEAPLIKQDSLPMVNSFVQPKVSKRPSLFSPPSDSEGSSDKQFLLHGSSASLPAPTFKDPSNSSSRSHSSKPIKTESQVAPKAIKAEAVVAPETFRRPEQEPAQAKVEPKPEMAAGVGAEAVPETKEESDRKDKRHKEKKKKKEKSRDKDREREETSNGAESSNSKKHKHKHKEKSKHRDSDRESGSSKSDCGAQHPAIKLKIKPLPPAEQAPPPLAPLKISLSQLNGDSSSDSSHRKRSRDEVDTGIGPASKMSRVLGTSVESESKFLHVVGGSSNPANHLAQKPPKKVSSR